MKPGTERDYRRRIALVIEAILTDPAAPHTCPKANVALVPGAAHNTFLDTCLPAVVDHLANLCKDNPGVDRDAVHTQSIETDIFNLPYVKLTHDRESCRHAIACR